MKAKLATFVDRGQLGIFANGYWGHQAMKLPPEVNLLAVSHYLQALDYQRTANKVVAHPGQQDAQHPEPGRGRGGQRHQPGQRVDPEHGDPVVRSRTCWTRCSRFVRDVYLTDVCAIGALYPDWLGYGAGVTNYMAVPDLPLDAAGTKFDLPGGTIMNGDLKTFKPITNFQDKYFADNVTESIAHAWYDGDWQKHPYEEDTVPNYTDFQDDGKYSWVKAPRFKDEPMQVGPLAQVLVGYAGGHEPTVKWLNWAIDKASGVAGIRIQPAMLHSTLGRHLARAVRANVIAEASLKHWQLLVDNIASGDTAIFNKPEFSGRQLGFGFHEAPRGTLAHFVVIQDGKIENYQAVVPSTWNAGPRDAKNRPGPYEASLVGNPIADPERPLEVLRTIHSFDPCLACAVHTLDPEGRELGSVRVL